MKVKIAKFKKLKIVEFSGETSEFPKPGQSFYVKSGEIFYKTSKVISVGARHFITENSTYLFELL